MNINKYKGKIIRWKNIDLRVLSVQRWMTGNDTKYRIKVCPSTVVVPKESTTMLITIGDMKLVTKWRKDYIDHQYDLSMEDAARLEGGVK